MRLDGSDIPNFPWYIENPQRLTIENDALKSFAPDLAWNDKLGASGGWYGVVPIWPFERSAPPSLIQNPPSQLEVAIHCTGAHPVAPPAFVPVRPKPPIDRWTQHKWHLNGDSSICMFRAAELWTGRDLVTELVAKASSWYLQYLLLEANLIETMTEAGIASSDELDPLIDQLFQSPT